MQAYQENISAKVNGVLTPILGVKVTVTDDSTSNPATLFSDNGVTQITGDIVTDETGYFGFFAANGSYTVSFSSPQIRLAPRNIDLYDPLDDAPLTQSQAASPSGASRLGYGQRTIENKLGDVVNVLDFGAVIGDSSKAIANAAAINAASLALSNAGGGRLDFPPGLIYIDGTLTVYTGVEWQGAGSAATVLRQVNATATLVKSLNFDTLTGGTSNAGVYRCAIRRMTLEGTLNASNIPNGATTQHGIQIYGYGFVLDADLHVRNFGGIGIYTEWRTPGPAPDTGYAQGFVEMRGSSIKIYNNGLSGLKINGPHDAQWSRVIVYNNNLNDVSTTKPNVWVMSKGNPQHFDQLHAWGASSGIALLADGPVKLSNCDLEGGSISQLRITTGECSVMGGTIFSGGVASTKGIEFVGGAGVCIGYQINTTIENCNAGSIDFGTGIDAGDITARIYQTAGTVMLGTIPTAGVGKALNIYAGGGANNRVSGTRRYSTTSTNLSTTDFQDKGLEYADHGGEGILALPQRKTEPAANYVPSSGVVACGRENALKFWQMSGHVGTIMGEPLGLTAPADNVDFSNYGIITLSSPASVVAINNFTGGLNGHPMFLLMPTGGAEITLTTTGNIKSKSGASITKSGLGSNRLLGFVKAKDGNYYQV